MRNDVEESSFAMDTLVRKQTEKNGARKVHNFLSHSCYLHRNIFVSVCYPLFATVTRSSLMCMFGRCYRICNRQVNQTEMKF